MKHIYIYLTLITTLLFISCGEEENPQTIPYAPCNFVINLNGTHNYLNGSFTIGAFVKDKAGFESLLSNASVVKVYNFPNLASERHGLSGVMILNKNGSLIAYDLCCPNEDNANTRVLPNNSYTAKCQKCKSEFDLESGGFPISGPGREKLQQYSVISENDNKYRILH